MSLLSFLQEEFLELKEDLSTIALEEFNILLFNKSPKKTIIKYTGEKVPWNFTGRIIEPAGLTRYLFYGKLHRLDGPAFEWSNGMKVYYIFGKAYSASNFYKKAKYIQWLLTDPYEDEYNLMIEDENNLLEDYLLYEID